MAEKEQEEDIRVYEFDQDAGEFKGIQKGSIPEGRIFVLLKANPASSYAIFQMEKYMVWLYHGEQTSVQMKFMSARSISRLRDEVLLGGKILTVDEGSEPLAFKFATKMEDPADYQLDDEGMGADFKPAYSGSADDATFEQLSLQQIALLMEQVPTPEGFEREAIIHQDSVFAIKNSRRSYMGSEIEELALIPLPKTIVVESGTYMSEDLVPRLMFENNKLVLVELLRKSEDRKRQESIFQKFTQQ